MSSALKPVLTAGSPNPPVTTQLNKPMLTQSVPSTYGQPMAHLPCPNPTNAHNPTHQSAHHAINSTTANHYSINVPNAPQHYPGNVPVSHSTSLNHPVSIPTHAQSTGTPTYSSPKNPLYGPAYQPSIGHTYDKPTSVPTNQTVPSTQPQHVMTVTTTNEDQIEKPQSNGNPEPRPANKEPPQNHLISPSKEKIAEKPKITPPPSPVQPQNEVSKPEVTSTSLTALTNLVTSSIATTITSPSVVVPVSTVTSTTPTKLTTKDSPDTSRPKEQQVGQQKASIMKLATTPRAPARKTKPKPDSASESPKSAKSDTKISSPSQKSSMSTAKSKRTRTRTQPYQSPLPEMEMISKITSSPRTRNNDDKLIIFYKNEFLAVRNSDGGFYICQAVQNIYKSSPRIRIRWLSQDKNEKSGEMYIPDFYDYTDFDCILTNLNLDRIGKTKYCLPLKEKNRTDSILKRALAAETGDATPPSLTEEHPDGLDLSLYKEESQLKKKKSLKRKATSPLKTDSTANSFKKSPEQAKVRKTVLTKKSKIKKTVLLKKVQETKRVSGRAERAKRRQQENQNSSTKSSPVVDHKKAKVLAKVVRKTAVAATKGHNSAVKKDKATKQSVQSTKGQKVSKFQAPTRKAKRSTRK